MLNLAGSYAILARSECQTQSQLIENKGLMATELKQAKVWERLAQYYSHVFYRPDLTGLRVALSVYCSHRLIGENPVWMFLIGDSSTGKTSQIVEPMAHLPLVSQMGIINEKTFINAYDKDGENVEEGKGKGLLFDLKGKEPFLNGVITWPEFSVFGRLPESVRQGLQSQMRMIYDGVLPHRLGNNREITWKGKVSMVAGTTQEGFNAAWGSQGDLGDRFLIYRMQREWDDGDSLAMVKKVEQNMGKMREIRDKQKGLIYELVEGLELGRSGLEFGSGGLPIGAITLLLCKLRQSATWDKYLKGIVDIGSVEKPGRIMNQAYQLGRGSAMLDRRGKMGLEDLKLVTRVMIDTMPQERWDVVKRVYVAEREGEGATDTGLIQAMKVGMAKGRIRMVIDELVAIGVLSGERAQRENGKYKFRRVKLSEKIRELMNETFKYKALVRAHLGENSGENLNVTRGKKWLTHDQVSNSDWSKP